jgi:hypothetical protein
MEKTMIFLLNSDKKFPEKIRSNIGRKGDFSICSIAKDILTILKIRIIHAIKSFQLQRNGKKRDSEYAG